MRYSITSNFKNLSRNWEKHVFCWQKMKFWGHYKLYAYGRTFGLKKDPESKYWRFDVLSKQVTYQMKTLQVQVYIQNYHFLRNKKLNLCKF